jgi:gliding motility-associated-like protein
LNYRFTLVLLLLCVSTYLNAQDYFVNGSASAISGSDCYRLTKKYNQSANGSVWYSDKLEVTKDFKLDFIMNFGDLDAGGADGIVFVIQTVGNKALGSSGGGIGFNGFSPSFGIEFDTYQNTDFGDPSYDHVSFLINGNSNHKNSSNIAGPVQISASSVNVEDNTDHNVTVEWQANTKTISLFFDCKLRLSSKVDLAAILKTNTDAFWGFTAATGGSTNDQTVCLRKDILVIDSFTICKGSSVQISAGKSSDNNYSWLPNKNINNANIQKPTVTPVNSGYYVATYKDYCDQPITDSIWITVNEVPEFKLRNDTMLCTGTSVDVSVNAPNAKTYLWNDGSTQTTRTINKGGKYWVVASDGKLCTFTDTVNILEIDTPFIALGNDTALCVGQAITLQLKPNHTYVWENNSNALVRTLQDSGKYWVTTKNICGLATDTINIKQLQSIPVNLGNDTILCQGEQLLVDAAANSIVSYKWQDGSSGSSLTILKEGLYFLDVLSDKGCKGNDSIYVDYYLPPSFKFPADTEICYNEIFTLKVLGQGLNVLWNGVKGSNSYKVKDFAGRINMTASNLCGSVDGFTDIRLKNCICQVYFPDAITVNQDNLNEVFGPKYDCIWKNYQLQIFNRWGEELFKTNNPDDAWNAKYQDKEVPMGYYFWISTYSAFENTIPNTYTKKGVLYIIR